MSTTRRKRRGFFVYYALNFFATGLTSAVAVVLWSTSMGFGKVMFQALEDLSWMMYPCGGVFVLVVVLLYLLDFFYPPHLAGQMMLLWDSDVFVGRGLLALGGLFLLGGVLLMTPSYPCIPVVVTTLFCPVYVAAVHTLVRPGARLPKGELLRNIVESGDVRAKMHLLKDMLGSEKDQLAFYKAATVAFVTNFSIILPLWIVFGVVLDMGRDGLQEATETNRDKIIIQWATPLLVAISHFVFALFGLLRVFMQSSYSATDVYRNRLIADTMTSSLHDEMLEYELNRLGSSKDFTPSEANSDNSDAMKEKYLTRHVQHIKQLSMLVKVVGCTFVLVIGALYVVGQLLYADSAIAFMVLSLLGAFFVLFILFVSVSFSRILWAMGKWLQDLPAWKALRNVASWSSIRAFFLCVLFPAIPCVLFLSFLNQLVRRCRGLDQVAIAKQSYTFEESLAMDGTPSPTEGPAVVDVSSTASGIFVPPKIDHEPSSPASATEDEEEEAAKAKEDVPAKSPSFQNAAGSVHSHFFTHRVVGLIQILRQWELSAVTWWVYFFCGLYCCYNIFPLLINVGLSWLRSVTASLPFGVIVASTFTIGVVAFLLPPVPGMTVYIFGGLVVSGTCPWGFWWGTVINVLMCWFLKLVACAIQQVCIGGLLGRSLWVRRTAGVHKVWIRCIEAELRKKGWTAGKVAILCGGPDWPTSVMAGVLGLSLWECELGTVPIIGFVLPCALTGSLYIRKGDGQIWSSAADLMVVAAVLVNLLLWAVAFWAIQNRLEADFEELNRRLPENVDLHWLDHREEEMAKRATVRWSDAPRLVRRIYFFGAVVHIIVCDALTFGYSVLFGAFAVQDDISTLVILPTEGRTGELFTWPAIAVLGVYFAALICFLQFSSWRRSRVSGPQRAAKQELDLLEAEWKEAFLRELAEEEAARQNPPAEGNSSATAVADDSAAAITEDGDRLPVDTDTDDGHTYIMVVPHERVTKGSPMVKVGNMSINGAAAVSR